MTVSDLRVLVENLDEYIHIPGGIERLKKTVLHLAISGQLVAQDPSEGTGHDLFEQIQTVHKPKKPLPKIDKTPFDIPDSWKWVNLAEVVEIKIGKTPSRTEAKYWGNDIPWVSIADLSDSNHINETKERVSTQGLDKCFKGMTSPAGTLLYSFKLTIGKMSIIDMDAVHNEAIASLITNSPITTEYLFKALKIIDPLAKTNSAVMGKTLNSQSLAVIEVPLPPLAEQERIIRRVDEIFSLIDELDKKYKSEEAERRKFVKSSLRTLSHEGSRLALDNLTGIIKTKSDAAELRKAILHLAVSGKLVPQIQSEGTGEDLYKQIQVESVKNIKRKKLSPLTEDEIPFTIPKSWKWIRFGEIGDFGSGSTPIRGEDKYYGGDINWFKSGELTDSHMTEKSEETVTATALKECSLRMNRKGDILIAMYGATAGKIGLLEIDGTTNQAVCGVTLDEQISRMFAYYWLLSTRNALIAQSSGAAQPNISKVKIVNHYFALPPKTEQERIVQKTTELLELVAELEKQL